MELNEKFIQDILKKRELQSKGSDGFSINLSGYQIEDWGEPMKYIVYILKVDLFDLSSNYLTRIMPELKNFDRLKELNLSENLIESGVELQGHPSLEILDLSNNKLSGSLNGFENMPILKILVRRLIILLTREISWQQHIKDRGNKSSSFEEHRFILQRHKGSRGHRDFGLIRAALHI